MKDGGSPAPAPATSSDLQQEQASEGSSPVAKLLPVNGETGPTDPSGGGEPDYAQWLEVMSTEFPIGIFRTDASGCITHVDECLSRMVGLDRSGFSDWQWQTRIHPDDAQALKARWSPDAPPWPEKQEFEFRLVREDARVVHILARLQRSGHTNGRGQTYLGFAQDMSLLHELEQSARLKGELNRQIIANSLDAVHVLDSTGTVVEMTAQACKQLGFAGLTEAQSHAWSHWWDDDGVRLARQAQEAGLQGVASRFLAARTSDDAAVRWWDTAVSPIADDSGMVRMLLVISRDVTEQRRQQQEIERLNLELEARVERRTAELVRQQQFLQTITDDIPGLLCYIDRERIVRFANAEYQRMLAIDPQSMIGRPIHQVLPPDMWQEIAPYMARALNGSEQRFESTRKLPSGATVEVLAHYRPDRKDGEVLGVYTQVLDISQQKDLERRAINLNDELEAKISERSRELLESEQRFRLMVDNLRDYMVYFVDVDGRVTDWTDSAQRMTLFSPVECMGKPVTDFLVGQETDFMGEATSLDQMLRQAAVRGQHEWQSWHVRKDGSKYYAFSLLIALRNDNGELESFAGLTRDMTDAKRLQDLMYNINLELEKRVEDRTQQLTAANNDLESFSYSVSHDLRSPLRHISSYVTLLEEHLGEQLDEQAIKYMGTIRNSSKHMGMLIDGLLAFSRMGRAAMAATPIDMGMLVEAAISVLAVDTKEHPVEWVLPQGFPEVECDPVLMREVWANLLGNAYKYSRTKPVSRIEVGWYTNGNTDYTFFVRDNGVGFDTKYADKLFGVFQRLHRQSEFEGTGIGLALVKRIIVRHGGHIWAESVLGEGSVFQFTLPFKQPTPSQTEIDTSSATAER